MSSVADIKDFADFQARLDGSIHSMDRLLARYPKDPMLASIRRQLDFVKELTRGGRRPSTEEIQQLTIGVMTARAVDDVDGDLGMKLHELFYYLKHWPDDSRTSTSGH